MEVAKKHFRDKYKHLKVCKIYVYVKSMWMLNLCVF